MVGEQKRIKVITRKQGNPHTPKTQVQPVTETVTENTIQIQQNTKYIYKFISNTTSDYFM
jgi:hypothetical protein